MQNALLALIVLVAFLALVKILLGKLGIGTPNNKPDCGCGRCAEKRRDHHRQEKPHA